MVTHQGLPSFTLTGEARQPERAWITGCPNGYTLTGEARQPERA